MVKKQSIKFSLVIAIALLTACSPKVENRGYIKQVDYKSEIKVGQDSREAVLEKLGSPSAKSSFGEETWYYVTSRKESVGFMKAEVVEQEVADIRFDNSGVVSAVNIYDKGNAKEFELVSRTTPTEGHSLSIIDQTLGNLGRFNKPGGGSRDALAGGRRSGGGGF